ncbi:hypothetical protein ROHU_002906 [Labeo rohita]|uniref:Uncharacterized protein n=1 Tax=Labeo rohita TaxID=84645 RepID=A0A498NJZ5_LABRO|nr:hypothetical protein ROHU_028483 [Labeo rohita]RXN32178.1 hypothetical protein ROHU_004703 [Labeo rohita]RXN36467.1 hypothetical protein ROHU_002906 [Labeo rohita]
MVPEGRVSLMDGSMEVPIKILRDTGAVDSFILESVLPFSSQSETEELRREQILDSSLAELFTFALSDSDVPDVARAYFVQDGLLLRKWSPHGILDRPLS